MTSDPTGPQQAEAALEALREIEKTGLRIRGEEAGVMPNFQDFAVNAVWMITDAAEAALRRAEAEKK